MATDTAGPEATLEAYVATVDPVAEPLVRALDEVVRATHPDFDVAVKYGLLMYTIGADWRRWVCAIGPTKKTVSLRFLYGVLLDDPKGVLRAGSSVLKSWDFAFGGEVDRSAVAAYVAEAVARLGDYTANEAAVLEASRAAAKSRPKSGVGRKF